MSYRTIHLLGSPIRKERKAGATIKPGLLVELTSTGTTVPQSVADVKCQTSVAFEDELQGKGIRDDYTSGDVVQINVYKPGEVFLGRLADGEVVVKGDKLKASTAGEVKKLVAPASEFPIGIALSDVDMSGSAGVDPEGFIEIEAV
jgi:hypothetical protein